MIVFQSELELIADKKAVRIDYDANGNPIYVGFALFGASDGGAEWLIKKIAYDVNNNPTSIKYPNGRAK